MSHCLLLLDDPILQDVYSLNLKMYTDVDSIIKNNHIEVISLFDHVSSVDLIITQEKIGADETADEIYKFLKETDRAYIPMIVLGAPRAASDFSVILEPKVDIAKLLKTAAKLLGVTAKDIAGRLVPEFFPIPVSYLENIEMCSCEIYKRSSDAKGDNMYYKVIDSNKKFTDTQLTNIKKSGHRHVYILSSQRLKFTNFYTRQVILKVRETKDPAKKSQLLQQAMAFVKAQAVTEMPLNDETIEVANVYIEETLSMITESQALKYFMKNILENTSGFAFQHSQLVTYISFHMVEEMDWGTKEQQQKLSFVAFFHDIVLVEDRLVQIHSEEEMSKINLAEKDQKLLKHHAYLACDLVARIHDAPMGADAIIKQHHGAHNGVGFPDAYSNSISPLAMVFIVAEEYVHYLLKNKKDFDHNEACAYLGRKFPKLGKWAQLVEIMRKLKLN